MKLLPQAQSFLIKRIIFDQNRVTGRIVKKQKALFPLNQ